MPVSGLMISSVGFVARMVLIMMAVPFLFETIGWMRLAFSLISTKPGSIANLVDEELANSMRFNPYSLGLLMASIPPVALAVYCLYVPIFPKKQAFRRLAFISMFAFFAGLIATACVAPSLQQFEDNTQTSLLMSRPYYRWKVNQDDVYQVPESIKKATIIWDLVQENLDCCGFYSPRDWSTYEPGSSEAHILLPRSCCRDLSYKSVQANGYCKLNMPHWTNGCAHQVHLVRTRVLSMMGSLTNYCIIFGLLASIMALCASIEERQALETIPNTESYGSPDPAKKNDATLITQEQIHLYPHLTLTPSHIGYGSR